MTYTPTYKNRCEDPECPSYGKPLVDRGYGYPVCETTPQRSSTLTYFGEPDKKMGAEFLD